MHSIAAKAVAFKEAMTEEFKECQRQTVKKCKGNGTRIYKKRI